MRNDARISQVVVTDTRHTVSHLPTAEMQNHQREYRELDPTGGAMRSALLLCREFEQAIAKARNQNEAMALRERLTVLVAEFGDAESAALRKAGSF